MSLRRSSLKKCCSTACAAQRALHVPTTRNIKRGAQRATSAWKRLLNSLRRSKTNPTWADGPHCEASTPVGACWSAVRSVTPLVRYEPALDFAAHRARCGSELLNDPEIISVLKKARQTAREIELQVGPFRPFLLVAAQSARARLRHCRRGHHRRRCSARSARLDRVRRTERSSVTSTWHARTTARRSPMPLEPVRAHACAW